MLGWLACSHVTLPDWRRKGADSAGRDGTLTWCCLFYYRFRFLGSMCIAAASHVYAASRLVWKHRFLLNNDIITVSQTKREQVIEKGLDEVDVLNTTLTNVPLYQGLLGLGFSVDIPRSPSRGIVP